MSNIPESEKIRIGLACAGGGIEGAVYEIGALCALEEALDGFSFTEDVGVYVGVSAGAIITACLANGVSAYQLSRAIISSQPDVHPIEPEIFFTPAVQEYVKRGLKIPGLIMDSVKDYFFHPEDISMLGSFSRLVNALPVGLFDNEPIDEYFQKNFSWPGRTNDFRKLKKKLRIVAVQLDSGKTVRFGEDCCDHVPISKAIQASSALPAVYMPVEIDGKFYVDGVARRTVHASVALKEGVDLLFCLNPIVPLNALSEKLAERNIGKGIMDMGLPSILSQTFRTMIYSRMKAGLKGYTTSYPDADIILFEPRHDDERMFFTNIFSFKSRKETCEYAYQTTRAYLRENADSISEKLKKHGIYLRKDVIADPEKTLYDKDLVPTRFPIKRGVLAQLETTLSKLNSLVDKDMIEA